MRGLKTLNDMEDVLKYLLDMGNRVYDMKEELNIMAEVIDDIISFLRKIEED